MAIGNDAKLLLKAAWGFVKVQTCFVVRSGELGGRPKDATCYDSEGKIDYELVKTKDYFIKGIDRLKTAYEKDINVAIMCSERNPAQCHRSKLIAGVLVADDIIVQHIDETGKLKEHAAPPLPPKT
ncbi:DUF488 domain-containing protein [Niastella populi]|uniref:DUF488 domain-containing protein n=1 Tax=Niastella populi TaxID=550983 RepID=UPI001F61E0F3|nr:DUF488 domain-containing protein [Niastella populi]